MAHLEFRAFGEGSRASGCGACRAQAVGLRFNRLAVLLIRSLV